MHLSSRTWSCISAGLLAAAAFFLWLDRRQRVTAPTPVAGTNASALDAGRDAGYPLLSAAVPVPASGTPGGLTASASGVGAMARRVARGLDREHGYRLINSDLGLDELAQRDTAILLENAFLDASAAPVALEIPGHLQAEGESLGWLVQLDRPLDSAFHEGARAAGAEFVGYVPNQTALVRASRESVERLAGLPGVRQLLAYEPAFKLSRGLLPLAVDQEALPPDTLLKVLLYPGTRTSGLAALTELGVDALAEDRNPFGTVVVVRAPERSLPALARVPEVQRIEVAPARAVLNDLSRVRVGVSVDTVTNATYLGLTGTNVLVNLNDTGVDESHPGLRLRVSTVASNAFVLTDPAGHGTHVAGTLAGDGTDSGSATNVQGSLTNALFSGMAPAAELFVLPIDLATGPLVSDPFLQEAAAREYYLNRGGTNVLISNNSWGYLFASEYDLSAASYDEATRDALPGVPGAQPILFVFAAGNDGSGGSAGGGGFPDSIISPATAKNVITVGAIEQLRSITNSYFLTNIVEGVTNVTPVQPFLEFTDSRNEVASFSSRGNVGIGRESDFGRFKPDVLAPGTFLVSARSAAWDWERYYDPQDPVFPIVSNLVSDCGPSYRYESGTSMAAPVVSGLLALLQEYFERERRESCPPALLKAMLIHGARSLSGQYDLQVRKVLNQQGWGLVSLTNTLPAAMSNHTDLAALPLRYFASPATNVLASGQSHTWKLSLSTNQSEEALFTPLWVTLAWTDPPGNPGAAIKLVNDLDLVVTNLDTSEVFVGNNFPRRSDWTAASGTNTVVIPDFVNNVENVFLAPKLGTNYSITVRARRVNVNSVTANVRDVVQDYALVVSVGDAGITNPIASLEWQAPEVETFRPRVLTNGVAEIKQRAGANFQLVSNPNGVTNQWAFYTFTNTFYEDQNVSGLTNGSNVAFITFLPPNLSRPRNVQSDIDLFVSKDPRLLDLDPAAVAGADKSLKRGGTELVFYTNAGLGDVFYVGVKAEDQQASEFGLIAQSSDLPFSGVDEFGNIVINFRGAPWTIPDGSPDNPGGRLMFGFSEREPVDIVAAYAELGLIHESVGDLMAILSHAGEYATLHNHNRFDGSTNLVWNWMYDDTGSGLFPNSRPTDGPGSLRNFIGQSSSDLWLLAATDDALGRTGLVSRFTVRVKPNPLWVDEGIIGYVEPNAWVYYLIDVPLGASALTVFLDEMLPSLPLDLYLRREELPTFEEYDKMARIPAAGGFLQLTRFDVPPLNPGRYFIGVYNPNAVGVQFRIRTDIDFDLNAVNRGGAVAGDAPRPILDDAVTRSTIFVNESRPLLDVQVGVRVDHPRASDLVFHLLSPQGTRVLLAENRGGTSTGGYGATLVTTNLAEVNYRGGPQEFRTNLSSGVVEGQLNVEYHFYQVPDTMRVYYEGALLYDTGVRQGRGSFSVRYGPGLSTNLTIVVNEGGNNQPNTVWNFKASLVFRRDLYTLFTEQTNLATQLIKFAAPPFTNSLGTVVATNRLLLDEGFEEHVPDVYPAGTLLGPWRVGPGAVVVHGPTNALGISGALGTTNFVELRVGTAPGGLQAEIGTINGVRYSANFHVRRNPAVSAGTPQVLGFYLDGVLVDQFTPAGSDWEPAQFVWRGTSLRSAIELRAASAGGLLLDEVRVFELMEDGQAYFLPEEDMLKPLRDATAFGDWTLEIWDNRAGPGGPVPPQLVSWTLNFVFANTNPPAVLLQPCTPESPTAGLYADGCDLATNLVRGDEILYYIVETPLAATAATNVAASLPEVLGSSGDLVLLYNSAGLPDGTLPGDVVINFASTNGEFFVLSTNLAPLLLPGQRYYLGVANADPSETNAFTISVTFDRIDSSLVAVPQLTNGLGGPLSTNLPGTNRVAYLGWTAAANGSNYAVIQMQPEDGDLDLYLRKARLIPDPLPRPLFGQYDYASTNSSTNLEEIVITQDSIYEPLEFTGVGTNWYVGVHNPGTNTVRYTVGASLLPMFTLRSGVPHTNGLPAAAFGGRLHYYRYLTSAGATNLQIDVAMPPGGSTGSVYVSRLVPGPHPLPTSTQTADQWIDVSPGTSGRVTVDLDSNPPLETGVYYVAVAPGTNDPAAYVVTITEGRAAVQTVIPLVDGQPRTVTLPAGSPDATYFLFSVAQPNPKVLFELYDLNQPAELLLERGAFPAAGAAFRTSTGSPSQPGQIVLRTDSGDPADLRGDWYLLARPLGAGDLQFTIRAALSTNGILASGLPLDLRFVPASPPATGWQFTWNTVAGERYRIESSTNLVDWTLATELVAGGTTASWADPAPPTLPQLFYRLAQVP